MIENIFSSYYMRSQNHWDYIVITASNNSQKQIVEKQIEYYKKVFLFDTNFIVVPDYKNKRIGSGGATLLVLKELKDKFPDIDFKKAKILLIHSGGDSKRIPQYSVIGKIFSPIPRMIDENTSSNLFLELLIKTNYLTSKINGGIFALSGDVYLDYDGSNFKGLDCDAFVVSFKADCSLGKNHGVFVESNGDVDLFLHKQNVDILRKENAIDENEKILIDTGAVFLGSKIIKKLFEFVSNKKYFDLIVKDNVRISLYGDFLYCMAKKSNLNDYLIQAAECDINSDLIYLRKILWGILSKFKLKIDIEDGRFLHFGTSKEVLNLMSKDIEKYQPLHWSKVINSNLNGNELSSYNSFAYSNNIIGNNCYSEMAFINNCKIGNNCIISQTFLNSVEIPDDVVINTVKLKNNKYVTRIFGVSDNQKNGLIFNKNIIDSLNSNKELINLIFKDSDCSLWSANIYPICDSLEESVKLALKIYDYFCNDKQFDFNKYECVSLQTSFLNADSAWTLDISRKIEIYSLLADIDNLLNSGISSDSITNKKYYFFNKKDNLILKEFLKNKNKLYIIKFYYYLSCANSNFNNYFTEKYLVLIRNLFTRKFYFCKKMIGTKNKVTVQLPLRINFGGGWTDTSPYCFEKGAAVLNASILINGIKPINVTIEPLEDKKIIFESIDLHSFSEFTSLKELQNIGDPCDVFALQKCALIACGIIPKSGGNFDEILSRTGGFKITLNAIDIPKGSGLGTSSILSSACIKAIGIYFGKKISKKEICLRTIYLEQIMSTAGGWQDQIGGIYPGFKLITNKAGEGNDISIDRISLDKKIINELNDRLVLIYTGHKRLARNILREIVASYLGNNLQAMEALSDIKSIAIKMKDSLINNDLNYFSSLMNEHWEKLKILNPNITNSRIGEIFNAIDDLIEGKMICGAGGGGYLQVILKNGITPQDLEQRLMCKIKDSNIIVSRVSFYLDDEK